MILLKQINQCSVLVLLLVRLLKPAKKRGSNFSLSVNPPVSSRYMLSLKPAPIPYFHSWLKPRNVPNKRMTAVSSGIRLVFVRNLPTHFSFPLASLPLWGKIKIEGRKCSSFRVQRLCVNQEDRRQMRGCKAKRRAASRSGRGGERIGVTGPRGKEGGREWPRNRFQQCAELRISGLTRSRSAV